jgi:hypothetical protein
MITITRWKMCLIGILSDIEFYIRGNIHLNKFICRFYHNIVDLDYIFRDEVNRKPVWVYTCSCGKTFLAQNRGKLSYRCYESKGNWEHGK